MPEDALVHMSHEEFKKISPKLTEDLANAIQAKLIDMGEDIKGLSWFSSIAEEYNEAKTA